MKIDRFSIFRRSDFRLGITLLGLAFAFITLAAMQQTALAGEAYPSRPVRLVVPTGAGGITDILARALAAKMSENMGQQVIVDNRTGAGGIIGTQIVANAAPDGYTLVLVFPSYPVNPSLYAKLPYDTIKDFAPISMIGGLTLSLIVSANFPGKNLADLIKMAKDNPGKLNYGSVGKGSLGHLGAELFLVTTGVRITQIPYKSAPQVATALIAGDISLFFSTPNTAVPLIKAGKIRALGVSSKNRLDILPDVPAIGEVVPGYEVLGWNGILAPAGTPAPIINRLHGEIVKALNDPPMIALFKRNGVDPIGNTPQQFAEIIRADIDKWTRVLRAAGIQPE